jgi:hypothetical protein
MEYLLHSAEAGNERVDIVSVVVYLEGGSDRCRHPQGSRERFGAVVAGPDGDAFLIENRCNVVRVHITKGKADYPAPL